MLIRSNRWKCGLLAAAIFTVTLGFAAGDAGAIPAFARKYRMSCTTCHAPVPRLKPYGEDFAGNGYSLEGKEPARYTFDTGDSLLTLVRELPLAIRVDAFVTNTIQGDVDQTDLKTPYGIKLMSGGIIAKNITYYLYFFLSEKGEITGLEDAFVNFNDLFGTGLDLTAGQFQVSDPLFKRELRLTLEDYQIYRARIGNTATNLTYDRGLIASYATPVGTDLAAVLVNGSGIGAADTYFDNDDWKNVMLRASQSFGPARIGGFGYYAKAYRYTGTEYITNKHWYWGVDGTIDVGSNVQINAQYLERTDENPLLYADPNGDVKTRGGFVEAVWAVRGDLGRPFVTFLYNYIDSDFEDVYSNDDYSLDYRSEALNFSYLLRRNFRLSAELKYREGDAEDEDEWNTAVGFVAAF